MADKKRKMPTERISQRASVMDSTGTGDPLMDAVLRGETRRKDTQRVMYAPQANAAERIQGIFSRVHDAIFGSDKKKKKS